MIYSTEEELAIKEIRCTAMVWFFSSLSSWLKCQHPRETLMTTVFKTETTNPLLWPLKSVSFSPRIAYVPATFLALFFHYSTYHHLIYSVFYLFAFGLLPTLSRYKLHKHKKFWVFSSLFWRNSRSKNSLAHDKCSTNVYRVKNSSNLFSKWRNRLFKTWDMNFSLLNAFVNFLKTE